MGGVNRDSRGALRHPLFWGALALLVLNDHVLKGAEVLPGALTGKLSDFAGLIVAPVLVAALFRARTTPGRVLAFSAVTLPFVAINVSPLAAEWMESAVALVGIEWRIWCDPSDLVGLIALPAAWWLLDAEPLALPGRRVVEGVGMATAAFACMATSPPPPGPIETRVVEIPPDPWTTAAYLHNSSAEDVDVRLRWVSAEFDCDRVRDNPGAYLSPEAFGEGITVTLDPGRNFPLSRGAAREALGSLDSWLTRTGCDAVFVQRDGSADAVVFFGMAVQRVQRHADANGPRGVDVGLPGDIAGGDGSDVILTLQPRVINDGGLCPAGRPVAFAYSSGAVETGTEAVVTGTEMLRDGCFEVFFEKADTSTFSAFLCVPMWAFDLALGDEVRFDVASQGNLFLTRLASEGRPKSELRLVTFQGGELGLGDSLVTLEPTRSEVCFGATTECGAYTAPAQVFVDGRPMHTGQEQTGRLADGRRYRLALGPAWETVVGIDGCETSERQPGMEINAVMLIEEVE